MQCRSAVCFLSLALLLVNMGKTEKVGPRQNHVEQVNFNSEIGLPGEVFVKRPVEIPEGGLEVLRNTERIRRCLKTGRLKPEEVPSSWFVGSEIHLDGSNEVDLVVLPNVPKIVAHDFPPNLDPGVCQLGAHTGPFWVLRNSGGHFELLLETNVQFLGVMDSKTKGFRDIRGDTGFVDGIDSITYRFDGTRYKAAERHQERTN
jgi:hypothetical protein